MRLRIAVALTSLGLFTGLSRAENISLTEKPDTALVYLTPYAVGPGVGTLFAINSALKNQSDAFLKLTLAQTWRFQEHWDMGLDMDWWVPGANLGGLLNLNYVFGGNGFRPFVGLGAGLQYVDDPVYHNFGKRLGVEGGAMVGMYMDVTDDTHLRLRVPLQVVGNSQMDRAAGLDVALLFSLPPYAKAVKQLKY
jgi:hypothetical protein